MTDIKIDLKELKLIVEVAKEPRVTKHPYFPVIHYLYALRILGVRHTFIADWLNSKFKTRINNNQLSDLLGRWKRQGLFNEEKSKAIAIQIQNTNLEEKIEEKEKTISLFKDKTESNLLSFMKEVSKKIDLKDNEKEAVKLFYEQFKDRYEIEELVSQFIAQLDSMRGQ